MNETLEEFKQRIAQQWSARLDRNESAGVEHLGPAELFDVRGRGCGSVLVDLAAKVRNASDVVPLLVWTDDAGAPEELPAWCRMTGQRYCLEVGTFEGIPCHLLLVGPDQSRDRG